MLKDQIMDSLQTGILEKHLAGRLSRFNIAKDKVFSIFPLGPGLTSTDPEEIKRICRTYRINLRLLLTMSNNETVTDLPITIREREITAIINK